MQYSDLERLMLYMVESFKNIQLNNSGELPLQMEKIIC